MTNRSQSTWARSAVAILVGWTFGSLAGPGWATSFEPPTRTEQYQAILAEWRDTARTQREALSAARAAGKTGAELTQLINANASTQPAFARRFLDLAAGDPADPGSRDALLWVASRGGTRLEGTTRTAIDLLLQHHANDPATVRLALNFARTASAANENLVRSFFDRATSRAAKGTAALALAQFLEKKAAAASFAAGKPVQPTSLVQTFDAQGRPKLVETNEKPFDDAYWDHLRACDAQVLRLESESLYDRLVTDYADVPYETPGIRPIATATPPAKTLGEVAEAHDNLAVGRPAPAIEGLDLDGKPMTLAEHRGKVVLLVFWGSWCGPCMAAVPHERALVARLKDRPFVLLGVNGEPNPADARRAVQDAGITWRSWLDGPSGTGAIANRLLVRGFPSIFLIDAQGVIRKKTRGLVGLDAAVDALIAEVEPAQ